MKNRSCLRPRPSRPLTGGLFASLFSLLGLLGAAACSSNAPPTIAEETPSAEPFAAPAGGQEEDPDATETNFIELVCLSDADCRGEDRCIFWPEPDAGAAPAADAGARVGRCKVPGAP